MITNARLANAIFVISQAIEKIGSRAAKAIERIARRLHPDGLLDHHVLDQMARDRGMTRSQFDAWFLVPRSKLYR
jgi:hypothetical protein